MSTPRFKKHKNWIGKDLTLHIGGGDRKIKDHDVLEGSQWAKFVGMGFLTQIADSADVLKAAAPASLPADSPGVKSEGSVTKSSAGKVSMGEAKGGKGGGKGKGHHVEKEPEAKVETEVKTEVKNETETEPKTDEPPADSEPKTDETRSE